MAALRLNGKWVEVADLKDASAMIRKDIEANDVGSSEWYGHLNQGEVRSAGQLLGKVSYNGRVWPAETVSP
jgi:hypothetical protein